MLHDPSADAAPDQPVPVGFATDEPDVIEWGHDTPRRTRSRLSARLRGHRRLMPLTVAALGAAAGFGSLVIRWGTISVVLDAGGDSPTRQEFSTGVGTIGGFGSAYLVGVLALVGLTALAFFSTPSVRRNFRVAGVATAAGLLALLVATTVSLEADVRRAFFFPPELDFQVSYEPGLVLAYLGTAAMGLALDLSGRSDGRSPAAESATESGAAPDDRMPTPPERRSRRDRSGSEEDVREVTVRPTAPFTRPEWEDRYRQ